LSALLFVIFWQLSCNRKEGNFAMSEGYVKVEEGLRLYYCTVGDGADTVIVPAAMYLATEFERFAEDRTLIFYDMRNRGRSDAVTDPSKLGMNHDISDLEAIRKHFEIDRISLIGWSYLGAMVALYAMEYPDKVKRLIQVGPIPPRMEPYMNQFQANNSARQDSAGQARLEEMRRKGIDKSDPLVFCREYWEIYLGLISYDPVNVGRFRSDYYTLSNEMPDNVMLQFGRILESLGDWDWRSDLANLKIPVLTIHGDFDTIPMEAAREWAASMPDARLLAIPNAGHLPFIEEPEIFSGAVETFLDGDWPDRAEIIKAGN
jgi:proline iminopeptidase